MTQTPPTDEVSPSVIDQLQGFHDGFQQAVAKLDADQSERKRSNRIAFWALVAAIILGVVSVVEFTIVLNTAQTIRDVQTQFSETQKQGAERGKFLVRGSVQLNCFVIGQSAPGAPADRVQRFNACVTRDLKAAP